MKLTKKQKLRLLGEINREIYLENNPHGFSCINKKTKNKKKYDRKQNTKQNT